MLSYTLNAIKENKSDIVEIEFEQRWNKLSYLALVIQFLTLQILIKVVSEREYLNV